MSNEPKVSVQKRSLSFAGFLLRKYGFPLLIGVSVLVFLVVNLTRDSSEHERLLFRGYTSIGSVDPGLRGQILFHLTAVHDSRGWQLMEKGRGVDGLSVLEKQELLEIYSRTSNASLRDAIAELLWGYVVGRIEEWLNYKDTPFYESGIDFIYVLQVFLENYTEQYSDFVEELLEYISGDIDQVNLELPQELHTMDEVLDLLLQKGLKSDSEWWVYLSGYGRFLEMIWYFKNDKPDKRNWISRNIEVYSSFAGNGPPSLPSPSEN